MFERRIVSLSNQLVDPGFVVEDAEVETMRSFSTQQRGVFRPSARWREVWETRGRMLEAELAKGAGSGVVEALARRAIHDGRLDDAESLVRKFAAEHGRSPALRLLRLQLLCRTEPDRVSEALRDEGATGVLDAADPYLLMDIALALEQGGELKYAREVVSRIAASRVEILDAIAELAELCWRLGLQPQAVECAKKALSLSSDCVPALNVLGCAHATWSRFSEAKDYYERALARNGVHRPSLINDLTLCTHYLGIEVDQERLRTYVKTYPSDLAFAHRVCSYSARDKRWRDVLEIRKLIKEHLPGEELALRVELLAAESFAAQGRGERAERIVEDVEQRLSLAKPHVLLQFGLSILASGGRSALAALFTRQPAWRDGNEWVQCALRGLDAVFAEDHESGLKELRAAYDGARPEHLTVGRLLVFAFFDRGQEYEEVARVATEVVRLDRTRLVDWGNAIYASLMAGDVRSAQRRWKEVSLRPAWKQMVESVYYARATHGLLAIREGDIEDGWKEYRVAESLAPDEETRARVRQKAQLECGRAYLTKQDPAHGLPMLEEARLGPDRTFAREALRLIDPTADL